MPEPMAIAAGATAISGILGFKGNQAAARVAQQTADYNAKIAENELVLLQRRRLQQETALRRNSDRLASTQTVATAASGVEMTGSPLLALADTFFQTELDALNIQYAGDVDAVNKASEAALSRAGGAAQASAFQMQAYGSLLNAGSRSAQLLA